MQLNKPGYTEDNLLIIGKVVNVHGIKGYLSLISFTEPKDNILNYPDWLWDYQSVWQPVPKIKAQSVGKKIILQIEGCADRDLARIYVGSQIAIFKSELPELAEGEYYWADLEGSEVFDLDNKYLGKVDYLFATGANDVIVIKNQEHDQNKEYLIPYVWQKVVMKVDLAAKKIWVDWDIEN